MLEQVDAYITIGIALWVLMSVNGIPPFAKQQESFLKRFSKKAWNITFGIVLVTSGLMMTNIIK